MVKVFFIGTKNGKRFNVQAEKGKVQTLMTHVLNAEDEIMEDAVARMGIAGECIDAMCWEADEFIEKMIVAMDIDGRFAVRHNSIAFGVATNEIDAAAAFKNEEF